MLAGRFDLHWHIRHQFKCVRKYVYECKPEPEHTLAAAVHLNPQKEGVKVAYSADEATRQAAPKHHPSELARRKIQHQQLLHMRPTAL